MTFLQFSQGFVVILVILLCISQIKSYDFFPLNIQKSEGLRILLISLNKTCLFLLLRREMGDFVIVESQKAKRVHTKWWYSTDVHDAYSLRIAYDIA